MLVFEKNKKEWEELASLDPYWAILSYPEKKFGKWNIEEFFQTGNREIELVMASAKQLGHPHSHDIALDFGCGVGRLTQALSNYFSQCYGVDVSETMIAKAKELHHALPNCTFIVNNDTRLPVFADHYFDMIYTNIVLQHLPSTSLIKSYISEFIRTLKKNGLLVFQLPSHVPFKKRLQSHRRMYALLRSFGFPEKFLYENFGLFPMRMSFIPENEVLAFLHEIGATVLKVDDDANCGPLVRSRTYYVTK